MHNSIYVHGIACLKKLILCYVTFILTSPKSKEKVSLKFLKYKTFFLQNKTYLVFEKVAKHPPPPKETGEEIHKALPLDTWLQFNFRHSNTAKRNKLAMRPTADIHPTVCAFRSHHTFARTVLRATQRETPILTAQASWGKEPLLSFFPQ